MLSQENCTSKEKCLESPSQNSLQYSPDSSYPSTEAIEATEATGTLSDPATSSGREPESEDKGIAEFKKFDETKDEDEKSYLFIPFEGGPLEDRIKRANDRWMQSTLFTKLVNDRLTDLESNVRKLLKQPEPSSDDSSDVPEHDSKIKTLDWWSFSAPYDISERPTAWKHLPEIDSEPKSVIEILVEEPLFGLLRRNQRNGRRQNQTVLSDRQTVKGTKSTSQEDGTLVPYRIRIRSPLLLKVLNEVTDHDTTIGPHKHQIVFIKPFKLLVTYAKDILQYLNRLEDSHKADSSPKTVSMNGNEDSAVATTGPKKETESLRALQDLRLLAEVIDRGLAQVAQTRDDCASGSLKRVLFSDLWHIFRPGQEVRTPTGKQIQLYRVIKVTGGRDLLHPFKDPPDNYAGVMLKDQGYSEGAFIIECFYINFDGLQYGPVNQKFQIRKFEGEREITSLPVYPFNCDPEHERTHHNFLERGKRFATLSNPLKTAHMQYVGLTLDKHQEQVESRVIVDFQLAFVEMEDSKPVIGLDNLVDHDERETSEFYSRCRYCEVEGCCGNDIIHPDYEVDEKGEHEFKNKNRSLLTSTDKVEDLSDEQKILLPGRVFGFVLRSRKWATFNMEHISKVEYTNNWSNLVIPGTIKDTVLAMVENHERAPNRPDVLGGPLSSFDLVQGKGKGLIILLHGEPGVGKTSTAECVADHTKRPLFPITCGDVGDNAGDVEDNLEKNFQLAHKWGCVLLLDEADVFLKRRTDTDLTRNAIVSIFLRTLEYYSGILFLTTNRVGQIDRAFKSRIHVSLYYPKFDKNTSIQIWKNNLKRIKKDFEKDGKQCKLDERDLVKYAKEHYKSLKQEGLLNWNGRQIRNAFQTAIALANFEAKQSETPGTTLTLDRRHFIQVANAARGFDLYLRDLNQGKNDDQLAREQLWRFDDFGQESLAAPVRSFPPNIAFPVSHRQVSTKNGRRRETMEQQSEDDTESTDSESDTDSARTDGREEVLSASKSSSDESAAEKKGISKERARVSLKSKKKSSEEKRKKSKSDKKK